MKIVDCVLASTSAPLYFRPYVATVDVIKEDQKENEKNKEKEIDE